jgi:hypothetical protein
MPAFSVQLEEFNIVSCTQVQTVFFITHTQIDIDEKGNGSIKLSALNTDEAMSFANKQIEIYKKPTEPT